MNGYVNKPEEATLTNTEEAVNNHNQAVIKDIQEGRYD